LPNFSRGRLPPQQELAVSPEDTVFGSACGSVAGEQKKEIGRHAGYVWRAARGESRQGEGVAIPLVQDQAVSRVGLRKEIDLTFVEKRRRQETGDAGGMGNDVKGLVEDGDIHIFFRFSSKAVVKPGMQFRRVAFLEGCDGKDVTIGSDADEIERTGERKSAFHGEVGVVDALFISCMDEDMVCIEGPKIAM
jgi:hypothetical protein